MPEEFPYIEKGEPAYQKWMKEEGIRIVRGHGVSDVMALDLDDWRRMGGRGAYIDMVGMEGMTGLYVAEVPPGGTLQPEKHLYDELIYVLSGQGATKVWSSQPDGEKNAATFEWQAGTLFSPPMNCWHQLFNLSGSEPARILGATFAPPVMDIYHNTDFVFNCPYHFDDRFNGEETYYDVGPRYRFGPVGSWLWDTCLIPDVRDVELKEGSRLGGGGWGTVYQMGGSVLAGHMAEWSAGAYRKAHYHGGGAILLIVRGTGYTLMWPNDLGLRPFESGHGDKVVRVDWQQGSVFSPPGNWFHQHFNTGAEKARQLALRPGSHKYGMGLWDAVIREGLLTPTREGGTMIEYEDEDPEIRRMYRDALAAAGVENRMPS